MLKSICPTEVQIHWNLPGYLELIKTIDESIATFTSLTRFQLKPQTLENERKPKDRFQTFFEKFSGDRIAHHLRGGVPSCF
ncbi:MAG: hypothetical protein DHS20C18_20760 [Saprospiraceae bacterium]|nr:MAG: hypothetical protein DHS20C18_20760 [Saprospiraceae bacterium]